MRRQRQPRSNLEKNRLPRRSYRPRLEEIESRLLPGETVELGFLAPFSLLGSLLPLPASRDGQLSVPASAVRSAEAVHTTEPGPTVLASDFGKSSPAPSSASRSHPTDAPQASESDAVFAGNGFTQDLAGDPLNPLTLFAAFQGGSRHAASATAVSGNRPAAVTDFALAALAGPALSSTLGLGLAGNATGRATGADRRSQSNALAGNGAFLHPGTLSRPRSQDAASWSSYAHDPQHTAISDVPSRPLTGVRWQTPVDLDPQYSGDDLFIHYGSPLVTQANTVIVPVKTGAFDGFRVEGRDGSTGALKWSVTTDYSVPSSNWTPPLSPVLTPANRLYIPGAGGTVYYMDNPDANDATIDGQLAFYGISNYDHTYDSRVKIGTPLTPDSQGNIYFGFVVSGPTPLNLQSGIARMDPSGNGSWVAASTAAADSGISKVVLNNAPALSNDQASLYVAVNSFNFGRGYLLRLDSTTLATTGQVSLADPGSGQAAHLPDDGTASPTVGPDGDVYFGVLENPFPYNHDRGWLLHFSADLTQTKIPGAFGWDDTASIVPATMVPSYTGSSPYLLMTKYNNYKELGGDGVNQLAILDPNATMVDLITGVSVMREVWTIPGITPDPELPMVREWCINTAAVDPFTQSILANSEDGTLYRWDMVTNSFTQSVNLTAPIGEAYTPTVIGVDGTVYAINNATLFAVG